MNSTAIMLARNVRLAIAATPKTTSRTASRDVDLCRNGEAFPNPAGASLDSADEARLCFWAAIRGWLSAASDRHSASVSGLTGNSKLIAGACVVSVPANLRPLRTLRSLRDNPLRCQRAS